MELSLAEDQSLADLRRRVAAISEDADQRFATQLVMLLEAETLARLRGAPGRWSQLSERRFRCWLTDDLSVDWQAQDGDGTWASVSSLLLIEVRRAPAPQE